MALGSNLGDRLEHLRAGVRLLAEVLEVSAVSPVVESAPQGPGVDPADPDFLNAVVRGRTSLGPAALLRACRRVEEAEGRTRTRPGAPRTLDVDLIFHGGRVIRDPDLTVPHPRWKERGFVLRPLLEIASEWRDPESGDTVQEICRDRSEIVDRARIVAPPGALTPR